MESNLDPKLLLKTMIEGLETEISELRKWIDSPEADLPHNSLMGYQNGKLINEKLAQKAMLERFQKAMGWT